MKCYYGTCDSTSAFTNKVSCDGFNLEIGAIIFVKFKYSSFHGGGNMWSGTVDLNVNNTGEIQIALNGQIMFSNNDDEIWQDDAMVTFVYDGEYWNKVV